MLTVVVIIIAVIATFANVGAVKPNKFRGTKNSPPVLAQYQNSEEAHDRNLRANVEVHCFDPDGDYVRGTYGNRGYFEGKLDGHTAYVNFYEITISEGDVTTSTGIPTPHLLPSSGAAVITYSKDWSTVDGPYWNSGGSKFPGSYGSWGANTPCDEEHACNAMVDLEAKLEDIRKDFCLWPANGKSHFNQLDPAFGAWGNEAMPGKILGQQQSQNFWFNIGFGNADTKGSQTGAYQYIYTAEQCDAWQLPCDVSGNIEYGRYSSNAISAHVKAGRIIAADLPIVSGPYAGKIDSGLYMIYEQPGNAEGISPSLAFVGIFCVGEMINGSLKLADCSIDVGSEMMSQQWVAEDLVRQSMIVSPVNNLRNTDEFNRIQSFMRIINEPPKPL